MIPRNEYPRPQFRRHGWMNLNGIWQFETDSGATGRERGLVNREKLKGKEFGVFVCFSGGGADKAIEKLRKALDIDSFIAQLILVDPLEKSLSEFEKYVDAFCDKLK